MTRLSLIFLFFFATFLLALTAIDSHASIIIREATSAPIIIAVAAIMTAVSMGFLNYVDGITKDVPGKENFKNLSDHDEVIDKLEQLRVEVLKNIFVVVALVIAAGILNGVSVYLENIEAQSRWIEKIVYSTRGACISSAVIATCIQIHGFIVATKMRSVIAKNRK